MNNYQLLIGVNRESLDLDEKVGIALSKVYENLDDPTKMYATWSKTIQVPMTAKNNRIFDNMFRQDQAVTTSGIDPRKKIPFVLLHNQEHILTGYAKVNDIDNSQKTKKYNVTLYSVIADIINDLKLCTFDAKAASDPKYVLRNPLSSGCIINRNLVKSCWEQTDHNIPIEAKTDLDWIGFMPTYQGTYPDFSSDKLELYDGRVDPYHNDPYESVEVDEHYLGDYRSYYQQPYVWVDGLFQLLKEKIEDITDYKLMLDPSWFNDYNPYWTKAIITCTSLYDNQDETGQNPKENYQYQWNQIVSNTTQQSDLSSNHKQTILFNHESGTNGIYSNTLHRFRAPVGGKAHFKAHYLWTLFAVKTDPQLLDGYCRLRDDNNLFFEFRAVDAQTLEYIPGAVKRYMFYSNSTDRETGYDTKIDVGIASRNYPNYVTTPDPDIVRKDTGYAWAGELNVDMDITWNRPYYIIFNQYAANNGDPFEFALGSWVPRWDWLWTDFYQDYDQLGVSGIRGHYWYLTEVNASVEESSSLRSNSKLTMDRIWALEKTPFEYLLEYIKMFRLVFDVDEDSKIVRIMTRERYFSNYSIEDWTDKLDRSRDYKLEPINFDKKWFNFKYKEAEGQRFKYYQDKYNANYGAYKVDTGYDFNVDSNDIFDELTPSMVTTKKQTDSMHNTLYSNRAGFMGYTWKYLPKEYFVENDDEGSNAGNSGAFYFRNGRYQCDGNMRHKDNTNTGVMWITDDSDYQIVMQSYCWSQVAKYITTTKWLPAISPYSGNYTFQFQQPKELYFNRQALNPPTNIKYIYDMWWKKYMDERYSVQTKVLNCYLYLTADDFLNFQFNKFVMIDNILYMVNQIKDFNLTSDKTTKVQLVQVGDISAYTSSGPVFPYFYTSMNDFVVRRDDITRVEVFSSSEWEISYCPPNIWANKNGNFLELRAYNINYNSGQSACVYISNATTSWLPVRMTVESTTSTMSVNPNAISFSKNGGTQRVNVYSDPASVTVVSKPTWCTCEFMMSAQPMESAELRVRHNVIMDVSASSNSRRFARSGNIVITNGYVTKTIQVSQGGNNQIIPDVPDVPISPDDPDIPVVIRRDLVAGEAVPMTLYTSKEMKLNSVQISNGVTSTLNSAKIGTVVFQAQPEMSEQHVLENKTADGGIITMQTADGELVKWNYNIGDITTRWTVAVHAQDDNGYVTVDGTDGNYLGSVEDGTQISISATAETGYLFSEWSDGDQNASRTITVNQDINLYPIFVEDVPLTTYTVANTLTYALNSNSAASVVEHTSYNATITAFRWYTLRSVTVTMGGQNITSSVYRNGQISIPDVTGNITVTATADWGEWDYVWSSQENRGPLDFTVYNAGGDIENCTRDRGQIQGGVWVHREGVWTLPTTDNLVWEMECGFLQAVTPGMYPLFDLANTTSKGGAVRYNQRDRVVETDLFTPGVMTPVGQSVRYGKEPQTLAIVNNNSRVAFKYGSTVSIDGGAIATLSTANTITCRVNGVGVDMYVYTIRARFKAQGVQTYSVSVSSNGNGTVYVNGVAGTYSQSVQAGTQLTLNAMPASGYQFAGWSDGNLNATRTLIVNANTTLTASFSSTTPANNEFWYWTDGSGALTIDPSKLLDSGGNALTITDHTFSNSKGVVTLSGDLAKLGTDAFTWDVELVSVQFPQSLTSIGNGCFNSCSQLASVYGIDNVTEIGTGAFRSCLKLNLTTIPQSVTLFKNDSFGHSTAFIYCRSLRQVDVQARVTRLPGWVFAFCTSLEDIKLPDTIETINEGAFYNCSRLKKVVLPQGLLRIENISTGDQPGAFQGCTSLQLVEFSQGLTDLSNEWAFSETGLTSIKLPDSLTVLGKGIFYKCDQMDTAFLGSGLQDIKDQCFEGCVILKEIYSFAPTAPTLGTNVFLDCPTDGILHIPNGSDYSTWQPELPANWTIVDDL